MMDIVLKRAMVLAAACLIFAAGAARGVNLVNANADAQTPGNADMANRVEPGQGWIIGSASEDPSNIGGDTGTSGSTYSGAEAQTYTVEVTTGGTPGTAEITTTSTGTDSSGPTTVTVFDTPIAVGTLGVTISFAEGITGWNISHATAGVGNSGGDAATSGGTYNPLDTGSGINFVFAGIGSIGIVITRQGTNLKPKRKRSK